ncbi:MAG TPA: O-antigen ligase family protein [Solirubrobacteraceae bacterium]
MKRRRSLLALLVVSTLVAAIAAKLNTSGNLVVAGATSHVLVDDPGLSIVDRTALPQDLQTLQARAELYGRLMTTKPVLDAIAKRAGIPADQISGVADITGNVPIQFSEAGSEEHASQLVASNAAYRLELQADPSEPILSVYAEAPSLHQALRLANSAPMGLHDYLRALAARQRFPPHELPQLRPLGSARGGITNSSARIEIAGMTFITAFALAFIGLFLLIRRPWKRREAEDQTGRPAPRSRLTERAAGDWPRTTRVLPWSIAGLIAMFWLTPFDQLQLGGASAPINITLDRVVLPIIAVIWLIAFAAKAGPGVAPRLRITPVHVAMGIYLVCAFLSVVLDAHYLNHTGELAISVKKVPLLVSYMSVFVIVASSVRRSEVPAFLTYTLILAVIVAIGVIYQYRSNTDVFTSLAGSLGPFKLVGLDPTNASVLDSLGRRWIAGPADYGVELVLMLSIALPIAVLGILKSKTRRQYLLHGIAVVVLLYAMFATGRKSALVAPAVVFLTMVYLRRRQLLTLAPLGLVIVVIAIAISPASLRNVFSQYAAPNASHVATVDSRVANYDAVRPDLWSHLLFGRGQGSYAPPTDRIVDSDIILPLVETGVLGLVAFLMIPVSVILIARKATNNPDPKLAEVAVCGVSAAVCFIAVATLYSVMSLPHGPDVFMYVVGLVVAALGAEDKALANPRGKRGEVPALHVVRAHRPVRTAREHAVPIR